MKLDGKYINVKTNILMMQPLPNVSLAYKLLVQEEKQREVTLSDSMAFMAFYAEHRAYRAKPSTYGPPVPNAWNKTSSQSSSNGGFTRGIGTGRESSAPIRRNSAFFL
uniref:Uncharacterized protein n=1 Tax=Chenopodium quinoa TaxID=63459 RepID=A0A803LVR2_CHEQI